MSELLQIQYTPGFSCYFHLDKLYCIKDYLQGFNIQDKSQNLII